MSDMGHHSRLSDGLLDQTMVPVDSQTEDKQIRIQENKSVITVTDSGIGQTIVQGDLDPPTATSNLHLKTVETMDKVPNENIMFDEFKVSSELDLTNECMISACSCDMHMEKNEVKMSKSKNVKGRLKPCINFWRNVLEAPVFILNIIQYGYLLPFKNLPTALEKSNNKSALINFSFVENAIVDLLKHKILVEVQKIPKVVNPLTVSENKEGKQRLILDLRHVNWFIDKMKFKCEGVKEALNYCIPEGYMFKFDLKSGYHHVDLHQDHQTYLGLSWIFEGEKKYFQFTSLAFGISTAPQVFTKLLRPLVRKWRKSGFCIVVFLDDGFGISKSLEDAQKMSEIVHKDLLAAGFLPNCAKSVWGPVKILDLLGFKWNMISGCLELGKNKIEDFKQEVSILLEMNSVTARLLAKIAGKLISFTYSLGDVCRLRSMFLHFQILNRCSWDCYLIMSQECREELIFWFKNISLMPFKSMQKIYFISSLNLYVDASAHACGGYCAFSEIDCTKSSTFRELKAVLLIIKSYINNLVGRKVIIYSDNQNVERTLKVGSKALELQNMVYIIFNMAKVFNFQYEFHWIPRNENKLVDLFSTIIDFDDWAVSKEIFDQFNCIWGPYTCDLFDNDKNFKADHFYSKYKVQYSSGVDAFSVDWSRFKSWLVPPIHLVSKTTKYMQVCRATGTLIIPKWEVFGLY